MAKMEPTPFLQGQVTHTVDPSDFWMRVGTDDNFKEFKEFEKKLNAYCRQQKVGKAESVKEYSMILVNCASKDSNQWRRATVHRISRQTDAFDVFYVDYGNTENVPAKRICEVVAPFIQQFPTHCHRYALAGIKPIASSWTSRGVKTFTKLATAGPLLVLYHSFDHPTMCFRVALYSREGFQRSITHELLDKEIGLPTEEEVAEYAQDVKPVDYVCGYIYSDYDQTGCSGTVDPYPVLNHLSHVPGSEHQAAETVNQSVSYHGWDGATAYDKDENRKLRCDTNMSSELARCSSPEAVVVPGFNVLQLQQRRMLSAAELQKETEAAVQAERKARLQQDIIECHRDLQLTAMHGEGSVDKWGPLQPTKVERQTSGGSEGDVYDRISAQIRSATGEEELRVEQPDIPLLTHRVQDASSSLQSAGSDREAEYETAVEENGAASPPKLPADVDGNTERQGACLNTNGQMLVQAMEKDSAEDSAMTDDGQYSLEKKLRNTLHELKQGEDLEMVCAKFYSLAPVVTDAEQCDKEVMEVLLQLLLEEGVKNPDLTDAAVGILDTYIGAVDGDVFWMSLRRCCEKFVKLPIGKMPSLHVNFASLTVKLLQIAAVWPQELQSVVQDFILQCLERWIIFNKKGIQTGAIHQRLEAMYLECVETVLPLCADVLQEAKEEQFHFIYSEMKGKVLESEVDYAIRSRLLDLLQYFQFWPSVEERTRPRTKSGAESAQTDQATQTDPEVNVETVDVIVDVAPGLPAPAEAASAAKNKATQTEKGALKSLEGSKKRTLKNADTQTEMSEADAASRSRADGPVLKDVGVQTSQLPPLLRGSSTGSSVEQVGVVQETREIHDSALDFGGTTPGRARRRRVLMEHLQGRSDMNDQESERFSMGSSPIPSPSPPLLSSQNTGYAANEGSLVDKDLASQNSLSLRLFTEKSAPPENPPHSQNQFTATQEDVRAERQDLSTGRYDSDYPTLPDNRAGNKHAGHSSPAALTQLSLQSIASGILGWSVDEVQEKSIKTCQEVENDDRESGGTATQISAESSSLRGSQLLVADSGSHATARGTDSEKHPLLSSNVDGGSLQSNLLASSETLHHPAGITEKGSESLGKGIKGLEDASGDNAVPDDWETRLSPEYEPVGPAGDAPMSATESSGSAGMTSQGSVYTDCQQGLDSSADADAEGWSMEDPSDPADYFQTAEQPDSTPACQHQSTLYGFENESDDSMDSFYEADYGADEPFLGVAAVTESTSSDMPAACGRGYEEAPDTVKGALWGQDMGKQKQYGLARISTQAGAESDNLPGMGVPSSTVSATNLGCLPGESIRTMPKQTAHTRSRGSPSPGSRVPSKVSESQCVSSMPQNTESHSPQRDSSDSSKNAVGYERRDLADSPKEKKASPKQKSMKGKVKFRPFAAQQLPLNQQVDSAPRPWVPSTKCTNCGAAGHMRYDCNKKTSNFFFD